MREKEINLFVWVHIRLSTVLYIIAGTQRNLSITPRD